jgi:hypothetical protein
MVEIVKIIFFVKLFHRFPLPCRKNNNFFFQTGKKVSAKFLPKNFEKLKSLRARGATVERKCGPFPVMWAFKKLSFYVNLNNDPFPRLFCTSTTNAPCRPKHAKMLDFSMDGVKVGGTYVNRSL